MNKKWRWNAAQFAERKWWQNYLKNKDIPGYLSWKKEYWQNLLKKCTHYFSIHSEDSILDAGCGPAGMFMLFENNKTVAFDPLIDVYETDLPHFKKNMYPYVHFVNAGLEDFTSTEKFDILFCMNAINHVHDIEKSFAEFLEKQGIKTKIITNNIYAKEANELYPKIDSSPLMNIIKQRKQKVKNGVTFKETFKRKFHI